MRTILRQLPQYFFILCGVLSVISGNGCAPPSHEIASNANRPAGMELSVDLQLNASALQILSTQCLGCHGSGGSGGVSDITNVDHLIDSGLVAPGDAAQGRLMGAIRDGTMPQGGGSLPQADITTLQNWILSMEWVPSGTGNGIPPAPVVVLEPKFSNISQNILIPKCLPCHKVGGDAPEILYDTYENAIATGKISPGNPLESGMYKEVQAGKMPEAPYTRLSQEEVKVIYDWIAAGAPNN